MAHHPLKVLGGERVDVEVGRRIHEVDRVRHTVLDGEFDRVHVVAQGLHDRAAVLHDALTERGSHVCVVDDVGPRARVVADREDLVLTETDATHEVVEVDELLQDHREEAGLVVMQDQLFLGPADVDLLPAAAMRVLEDAGQADVLEDAVPVERVLQVAQRFARHDAGDVVLVGQEHRARRHHAELGDE